MLRLLVPRGEGSQAVVRAFDVTVSDVDVLLELKPEGKVSCINKLGSLNAWLKYRQDETVVTVGITDLIVHDTTPSGKNCFLSLTTPRSLVSIPYASTVAVGLNCVRSVHLGSFRAQATLHLSRCPRNYS